MNKFSMPKMPALVDYSTLLYPISRQYKIAFIKSIGGVTKPSLSKREGLANSGEGLTKEYSNFKLQGN